MYWKHFTSLGVFVVAFSLHLSTPQFFLKIRLQANLYDSRIISPTPSSGECSDSPLFQVKRILFSQNPPGPVTWTKHNQYRLTRNQWPLSLELSKTYVTKLKGNGFLFKCHWLHAVFSACAGFLPRDGKPCGSCWGLCPTESTAVGLVPNRIASRRSPKKRAKQKNTGFIYKIVVPPKDHRVNLQLCTVSHSCIWNLWTLKGFLFRKVHDEMAMM